MPLANYSFYIASFLFFIADVLQKTTSKGAITWQYLVKRSIYSSVLSVIVTIVFYGIRTFPSLWIALQMSGCSICCGLGLLYYIKAVISLNFSNVGSLEIIGNVLKQLSGIFLFHEHISKLDILSYGLMSFGCIFQLIITPNLKGAKFVVLSSFFWTVGYIILSYVLKSTPSVYWSVPIMEVTILVMSLVMVYVLNTGNKAATNCKSTVSTKRFTFVLIASFIYVASLLNNYAFQKLPLTTINMFQLSMMPIGYLLSLKIFKERPSTVEIISFCTGFVGFALFIYEHNHN